MSTTIWRNGDGGLPVENRIEYDRQGGDGGGRDTRARVNAVDTSDQTSDGCRE